MLLLRERQGREGDHDRGQLHGGGIIRCRGVDRGRACAVEAIASIHHCRKKEGDGVWVPLKGTLTAWGAESSCLVEIS